MASEGICLVFICLPLARCLLTAGLPSQEILTYFMLAMATLSLIFYPIMVLATQQKCGTERRRKLLIIAVHSELRSFGLAAISLGRAT